MNGPSSREWLDRHLERALEGARVGPYLIVRRLGAGGQGVVFEARQERPDRRVALKLLLEVAGGPRERRRRCLDEAEALLRLRHPHVAQVTDAGVHRELVDGRQLEVPYLALEMVVGARTLLRHADEERLSTAERLSLFVTVCDAVAYGHRKGVVHGDLKPDHLLVDSEGVVKVVDFGLARVDGGGGRDGAGTPGYVCPERLAETVEDVDTRTDVYALGVVLAELLGVAADAAPRSTLGAATRDALLRARPPHVASPLRRVLLRALEPDRDARYAGPASLADDLRRFLRDEPVHAAPAGPFEAATLFARRHRRAVTAAATALAALLAGGAVLVSHERTARAEAKGLRAAERDADLAARRATSARTAADATAAEARTVSEFLVETLARGDGADAPLWERIEAASPDLAGRFATQPRVAAVLSRTFARSLVALGRPAPAEAFARARVRLLEELDPDGAELAEARGEWGALLGKLGRTDEAARLTRDAAIALEGAAGPADRRTLVAWNLYGRACSEGGDTLEAEAVLRRTLKLAEAALGADDPDVLSIRADLACCVAHGGRFDEARVLSAANVEGFTETLGARHPQTLEARHALASLLLRTGRLDEAEAALDPLLSDEGAVLGEEHALTLQTLEVRASAARQRRDLALADALLGRCHAGSARSLGDRHPDTTRRAAARATVLSNLGRPDEALALADAVLEDAGALDAETRRVALHVRARVSLTRGDERAAQEALVESLEAEATAGRSSAATRLLLARSYARSGRADDASAQLDLVLADPDVAETAHREALELRRLLATEPPP